MNMADVRERCRRAQARLHRVHFRGRTLADAAEESGYSTYSSGGSSKGGTIPSTEKKGRAILAHRGDPPRKPELGVQRVTRHRAGTLSGTPNAHHNRG